MLRAGSSASNIDMLPSAYHRATRCFEYTQYDRVISDSYVKGMLKFNDLHVRLTRWGTALGLDTFDPNTGPHRLPESHPMHKSRWEPETASAAVSAMIEIRNLFKDLAKRQTRDRVTGASLTDLALENQSKPQVRLCMTMSGIAAKRMAPNSSSEGIVVLLEETHDGFTLIAAIAEVVDNLVRNFPRLRELQKRLAHQEAIDVLQSGLRVEDLKWFQDGPACPDNLLRDALAEELPKHRPGEVQVRRSCINQTCSKDSHV